MRRVVGRKIVDTDAPNMIWKVTVVRRWWQSNDEFYSDDQIGVSVSPFGVLTVNHPLLSKSYNVKRWVTVNSRQIPSKIKV